MKVEEAVDVLRRAGCSPSVVKHCLAVQRVATEIAKRLLARGHGIDLERVRVGAVLHDIGRSRTHGVEHGVVGGRLLRDMGLSEWAGFAENHIGGGIPSDEAEKLGLPKRDYFPASLEELVVAYADKLVDGEHRVPFERTVDEFKRRLGAEHPAVCRLWRLHRTVSELLGEQINKTAEKGILRP